MNISSNKKRYVRLLIVLLLVAITTGGVFMLSMLGKSQEERRNREYEVSLVNALKNSYQGIEEIKISNPAYTSPPGSWSCDIEIKFNDERKTKYRIGHGLHDKKNYQGSLTNEKRQFLNNYKGVTNFKVIVTYSDNSTGEQ
ncbi:hypothetical protein [Streptococcus oralis]|nr:hypothetical protein [Streptococcus oralis]MBA1351235.1 hypothetical protein [Streptococcus oralis subsp. oralis]